MEWTQVSDDPETNACARRRYERGKERLSISVYRNCQLYGPDDDGRLFIESSYKRRPNDSWEDGNIPRELVPELIEMLNQAIKE